jgi:hypothetical protein
MTKKPLKLRFIISTISFDVLKYFLSKTFYERMKLDEDDEKVSHHIWNYFGWNNDESSFQFPIIKYLG